MGPGWWLRRCARASAYKNSLMLIICTHHVKYIFPQSTLRFHKYLYWAIFEIACVTVSPVLTRLTGYPYTLVRKSYSKELWTT
jgi:hypothetical protein